MLHFSNWLRGPDDQNLLWMRRLSQQPALCRAEARLFWKSSARGEGPEASGIDVISVSFNSCAHLSDCIGHVLKHPGFTCVVVDNASSDDSVDLALRAGATVVSNPANLGYAAAANIGARHALSSPLLFLNPDGVLTPAAAHAVREASVAEPETCWVPDYEQGGGTVKGVQKGYTRLKVVADVLESAGIPPVWIHRLRRMPWHHAPDRSWPLGACMLIGRREFERIGGFNETYFMYMEDVDMGEKLA